MFYVWIKMNFMSLKSHNQRNIITKYNINLILLKSF